MEMRRKSKCTKCMKKRWSHSVNVQRSGKFCKNQNPLICFIAHVIKFQNKSKYLARFLFGDQCSIETKNETKNRIVNITAHFNL